MTASKVVSDCGVINNNKLEETASKLPDISKVKNERKKLVDGRF